MLYAMATDTKQKVQCFFSALDEAKIVDNEIVDYLASILDPESIDDSTLTDVQLIVASTSAAFARLPEDKQTQLLLKLFDQVGMCPWVCAATACTAPAQGLRCRLTHFRPVQYLQINHSTTASTAVFAVTDAGIGSGVQACKLSSIAAALNQLDLCTEQSPAARAPHESDSQQQASANEVAALMDMCQCSVSREFITSVLLEQCKGNVEVRGCDKQNPSVLCHLSCPSHIKHTTLHAHVKCSPWAIWQHVVVVKCITFVSCQLCGDPLV